MTIVVCSPIFFKSLMRVILLEGLVVYEKYVGLQWEKVKVEAFVPFISGKNLIMNSGCSQSIANQNEQLYRVIY